MLDNLIQWIKDSIESLKPWTVINVFERGVAITFGKYTRVLEPGMHWIVPLGFTDVFVDNVVWRTGTLGVQSLVTKDEKAVTIEAIVTSRIRNIEKAILGVEGVDHALIDACAGAVGHYVATHTWAELLNDDLSTALVEVCQKGATRYGIEIDRVQLKDLTPARAIRLLQASTSREDSAKPLG